MRIIKGKYRAKLINPPKALKARPTTSNAKESLFNILENNFSFDFESAHALDLFAGTGSIGYELLSRGVKSLHSVELDYTHFQFIKKFIHQLEVQDAKVIKADAFRFLKVCTKQFELIFADPPYNHSKIETLAQAIFDADVLKPDAVVVIEHPKTIDYTAHAKYCYTKVYGKVHFSFFQNTVE